jgi:DNA-directed RNA polymerase specialized sigma24 family protein
MEGLGYAEIGEILGITLPTVKTRLFRARATLRETMREVWR